MPSSAPDAIPAIVSAVWSLAPRSILDVGAGNGKYGVLFREYLEERLRDEKSALPTDRLARVDAVEGFADYIGPLHRCVYDTIHTMLIQDFVQSPDFPEYDMIYAGDIIEHLDKGLAQSLVIPRLLEKARIGLIISVPWQVEEQGAVYGNQLEVHRSHWTAAEFAALAPHAYVGRRANQLVALLSRDPSVVAQFQRRRWRNWARRLRTALRETW